MLCLLRCVCFTVLLSWSSICTAQSSLIDSIITQSSLKEIVQVLAADSFQGRLTGSPQAVKAAHFIGNAFNKAGVSPIAGNDGYFMPFETSGYGTGLNIIGAIRGRSKANELVIFSAHYDHVGSKSHTIDIASLEKGKPEKGDVIYNGANDNASGVSGLIHLARYYGQLQNNERTLIFIAFSGEEEGLLGSKKMVESFRPKGVIAMVNMDMIGRPISNKKKYPYITGHLQSNLRDILNKKLFEMAPQYGQKFFKIDAFVDENLFSRSDNYPFAKAGIAAHTIMTSSPADTYYHSLNDEWETLDYPFMANVVKAIALACTGLVDGTDAPK